MEGYDINKIKHSNQPSLEERLTGKVVTGLDNTKEVQPNAELEGGEYIKFPDGTTQLVAGNKHSKGGVKMHIPDGSEILSHALKLTKDQANTLKNDYELNVSTKDTYASALTKFTKKIGLEKLYEDEKELIKVLDKQIKGSDMHKNTNDVNKEYLSKKIKDIEDQKQSKESAKTDMFGTLFQMQELVKKVKDKEKFNEGKMQFGGVSQAEFNNLLSKHGLSERQAKVLISNYLPEFSKGGSKDDGVDPELLKELEEKYPDEESLDIAMAKRLITKEQYLAIQQDRMDRGEFDSGILDKVDYEKPAGANVRVNYPYEENEAYGPRGIDRLNEFRVEKYGLEPVPKNASKEQIQAAAGELQAKLGAEYPELVYDYMMTKSHKPNRKLERLLRDVNEKEGKKYSIDNEGLNKAVEDGLISKEDVVKGYQDNLWWYRMLDIRDERIPREEYEKLMKRDGAIKQGDALYFAEFEDRPEEYVRYIPYDPEEGDTPVDKEVKEKEGPVQSELKERAINQPRKTYPRMFGYPNEIPLPPTGMQAHLMGDTRLQRLDPVRIGIEPQIQQAGEQREFMSDFVNQNLAPNVAASVMANTLASGTQSLNDAARKANMINAENLASTELFNIGQAAKEAEAGLRNALSFEQRQFTAKAKTEENIRNFFDQLRKIRVNRFASDNMLNLLNQRFDDFNVGFYGDQVNFEPTEDWRTRSSSPYSQIFGSPFI